MQHDVAGTVLVSHRCLIPRGPQVLDWGPPAAASVNFGHFERSTMAREKAQQASTPTSRLTSARRTPTVKMAETGGEVLLTRRLIGSLSFGLRFVAPVIGLLFVTIRTPWAAAQETVELVVVPGAVTMPADGSVRADLIVRNSGSDELRELDIYWFTSGPLSVSSPETLLNRLPSGDAHSFRIDISHSGSGALPGEVTFEARYATIDEQGTSHVHTTVSAPIKVSAGMVETASQVAKVEIRTALASLNEKRPGDLYLLITNISDVDISVQEITRTAPEFITLELERAFPFSIASGRTVSVPYDVSAGSAIQPGKQLLLFDVQLSWPRGDRRVLGNVIATQEVSVEVFGESAILGLISVPAFLLLPGALIVLSFELCLLVLWKRSDLPLTATSAQFWLCRRRTRLDLFDGGRRTCVLHLVGRCIQLARNDGTERDR